VTEAVENGDVVAFKDLHQSTSDQTVALQQSLITLMLSIIRVAFGKFRN
jgi:hypothetical protein